MAQTREGAIKVASKRQGITPEQYMERVHAGEKWCIDCKCWHAMTAFAKDRSRSDGLSARCRGSHNKRGRDRYTPHPLEGKPGPKPMQPRSGDKVQARQRVNVEVRTGYRPHPNSLPCVDCNHVWTEGDRRHEYDHYLGYEAEHHYDVQPVCTTCHARRARERGEIGKRRGGRGRSTANEEVVANG